MTNPYHWIPNSYLWMVFMGLVLITVGVAYTISRQGKPLSTEKLPNGILEIEVPWSTERATVVVASWERKDLLPVARKQVYYDFLFLLLYPLALSLACAWLAGSVPVKLSLLGVLVSWGVLLAAPLDAIENIAILRMLGGSQAAPVPQIATIAAAIKFTLVFGAVGYLGIGGLLALIQLIKSA
jgi:hypothetical protein